MLGLWRSSLGSVLLSVSRIILLWLGAYILHCWSCYLEFEVIDCWKQNSWRNDLWWIQCTVPSVVFLLSQPTEDESWNTFPGLLWIQESGCEFCFISLTHTWPRGRAPLFGFNFEGLLLHPPPPTAACLRNCITSHGSIPSPHFVYYSCCLYIFFLGFLSLSGPCCPLLIQMFTFCLWFLWR